MSRRATLPGAEELFRSTHAQAPTVSPVREVSQDISETEANIDLQAKNGSVRATARRRLTSAARGPSGRERHEEKITVYVSPDELFDLEQARLSLRGEHGLAVDRGRIVREALAVIVADLEAKGESSILVRRLRGR
ncbi:MAG TPA: cobyrinic acid a,c-diamide synthase [Candidatus Nanopelagicaceae bacterium]|nr:cobyrinic acid a,c-diamide synthase [Candidatus Nanopelagicaceae bacterium]